MLRLDDPGPWSFSEMGTTVGLKSGSSCFILGYPALKHLDRQSPLLRLATVSYPGTGAWLVSTAKIFAGDSGGGIFDLNGRLIGINVATPTMNPPTADHVGIDVFLCYRDKLREGKLLLEQGERVASAADRELHRLSRTSVVEILCDGRPAALGTIVDSGGWIMTKRTELFGKVECKLSDGSIFVARSVGESFEHDLALLKIDAPHLQTPEWAEKDAVQPTRIVVIPRIDQQLLELGVIGQTKVENPGTKGWLLIGIRTLEGDAEGVLISEVAEGPDLEGKVFVDDIVTQFNGIATPTTAEFVRVRDEFCDGPRGVAGERVELTIKRGNEILRAHPSLQPEANETRFSLRSDGFPEVLSHDATVSPEQCGGPIFDAAGRMLGINIARADDVRTFAIPSYIVKQIFKQLKPAD
jgi:serine protease Do